MFVRNLVDPSQMVPAPKTSVKPTVSKPNRKIHSTHS